MSSDMDPADIDEYISYVQVGCHTSCRICARLSYCNIVLTFIFGLGIPRADFQSDWLTVVVDVNSEERDWDSTGSVPVYHKHPISSMEMREISPYN